MMIIICAPITTKRCNKIFILNVLLSLFPYFIAFFLSHSRGNIAEGLKIFGKFRHQVLLKGFQDNTLCAIFTGKNHLLMLAGKALKKIKPVAASFEWQFEEGSIVYIFCVYSDAAPLSVINFKFTTYTQQNIQLTISFSLN